MAFEIDDLPETIRVTKRMLCETLPNHAEIFREVETETRRRVNAIVKEREAGHTAGTVPPQLIAKIRERGACVIRNTFASTQATAWDQEIAIYVELNGLDAKLVADLV